MSRVCVKVFRLPNHGSAKTRAENYSKLKELALGWIKENEKYANGELVYGPITLEDFSTTYHGEAKPYLAIRIFEVNRE